MAMSAISELGSMLDMLKAKELDAVAVRPFAGRFHGRDAEIVCRYGVRRALSGLLWGDVDVLGGAKVCLPAHETDFTLPARFPLRWSRNYSSALPAEGALGVGWRVSWEVTLCQSEDRLTYHDEHGRAIDVPCPRPGSRVTVLSERLHIACLSDGTMVVADFTPSYRVFDRFDAHGVARLKYIEDVGGERIGCIWEESGRLARIGSTAGHVLRMRYADDGRRLTAIESVGEGPTGILAQYRYDDDGQLARVDDRTGATIRRYGYRGGCMVEEVGALGGVTRYVWEADAGKSRLVERSTDAGARERFRYMAESRTHEVTDVFGNSAQWRYDSRGCVVAHRDFDGARYAFQHGRSRWPVVLELPGDRRITLALDNFARVVKETDASGQWRHTNYAGGTLEPLVSTLSSGQSWAWTRNDQLQPQQYQTPDGPGTIDYDDRGWAVRHILPTGGAIVLERDSAGRVIRQTDAQGRTLHYGYGPDGHIAEVRDALGGVTRLECNALGWPAQVIRPDSSRERHGWNALGQPVEYVGADGQTKLWQRDGRGRVVREINEEGHAIEHVYDAHGRRVRTTSGNGAVQSFEWDAVGRLSKATDENGVARVFTYTDCGVVGRVTAMAGGLVRQETFSHDALGRVVGRETAHSHYLYTYGADGRLERVTRTPTAEGEALGIAEDAVRFTYSQAGQVVAEESARGTLRYAHDDAGHILGVQMPQGQVMQFVRDDAGWVTLIAFEGQHVAEFRFDAMKRETLRMQRDLLTYTDHDALGAPVRWRGVLASESRDRAVDDWNIRFWREVSYGPGGKVVKMADDQHGPVYLDYDRSGNLLRRVSDDLGIERFSWDGSGNPVDLSQTLAGPPRRADHRLAERAGWQYTYDTWGQVVGKSGNRDAMTLEWDAEGHLVAVRMRNRIVKYQYDALGRCIQRTAEAPSTPGHARQALPPRTTRFVWQDDCLIQEIEDDLVRTYIYLPAGRGYVSEVPLALVDQVLDEEGKPQSMRMLYYQTDVAGTAVALTDADGSVVWSGRYNALGKRVAQDGPAGASGQPLHLAGQFADEETGLHWHGRRIYDPDAGRYLAPDRKRLDGHNPYAQVAARTTRLLSPQVAGPATADAYWNAAESARLHSTIQHCAETESCSHNLPERITCIDLPNRCSGPWTNSRQP